MNPLKFSASAKLLLFGEYLVLRGAKSMALPLKFSQTLTITDQAGDNISWECYEQGQPWLTISLSPALDILNTTDYDKAALVAGLLSFIRSHHPALAISKKRFRFDIDFNRQYGLGTSSTMLSLLGQWSGVNAFLIQDQFFKGSGFDIAAATASQPIIYQIIKHTGQKERSIIPCHIAEDIRSQLLFVYTGRKQVSLSEVLSFDRIRTTDEQIGHMNQIVDEAVTCRNIVTFESLMQRSEQLMSGILQTDAVKDVLFPDYPYAIKSLGAWGGDFVMAAFRDESKAREYFQHKNMHPIFNYRQLEKK